MNVFFDVDYTLVDADGLLRPYVKEVLQSLIAEGHTIYLWSGAGPRWEDVDEHDLRALVQDCFTKPLGNYQAELARLGVSPWPDYVVDDQAEIVSAFGGFIVSPFGSYTKSSNDTDMLRVCEDIRRVAVDRAQGVGRDDYNESLSVLNDG